MAHVFTSHCREYDKPGETGFYIGLQVDLVDQPKSILNRMKGTMWVGRWTNLRIYSLFVRWYIYGELSDCGTVELETAT